MNKDIDFNDEILYIEEVDDLMDTIDIQTDGNHLFYANKILTHNSGGSLGYAGADISMNNTSDSAGINMDADAIFALFQLEGEREIGRLNVKILKNRLGGFVGTIFNMNVDYNTLRVRDFQDQMPNDAEHVLSDLDSIDSTTADQDAVNIALEGL